jgi:hypothetical protein
MKKLYISPTPTTPEVSFSPEEDIFFIRGNSSPEDVRALYYPVIEWVSDLTSEIINGNYLKYSKDYPLVLIIDLEYFNSSSAKFLFDIFNELKQLKPSGIPVKIEWHHDKEDIDMRDAGSDISSLVGMEFQYIQK